MYPKIMSAGPWQKVVVANEEQEKALPVEYGGLAQGASQSEVVQKPEKTKDELQAECDDKDIKYDKRWGADKLIEALS